MTGAAPRRRPGRARITTSPFLWVQDNSSHVEVYVLMASVVNGRGVPPHPGFAVVEVWSVMVDDEQAFGRCLALVPPEERARLSLLVPPHRHRHTCAHAAVRILASAAL